MRPIRCTATSTTAGGDDVKAEIPNNRRKPSGKVVRVLHRLARVRARRTPDRGEPLTMANLVQVCENGEKAK